MAAKFKTMQQAIETLDSAIKASAPSFVAKGNFTATGPDADAKVTRRRVFSSDSTALMSARVEEAKQALLLTFRVKDIALTLNRRSSERAFAGIIEFLDQFAVLHGYKSMRDLETKVKSAQRRAEKKKIAESAKAEEIELVVRQQTIFEQHPVYGSW